MRVTSVLHFIEAASRGCSPLDQVLLSERIRALRSGSVSGSDRSAEHHVMLSERIRSLM